MLSGHARLPCAARNFLFPSPFFLLSIDLMCQTVIELSASQRLPGNPELMLMLPTHLYFISVRSFLLQLFAKEPISNQKEKKLSVTCYRSEKKAQICLSTWTQWQLHWPIADSSAFNFTPARAGGLGDCWVSGGLQIEADVLPPRKHLDLFSDWTLYLLDVTPQSIHSYIVYTS